MVNTTVALHLTSAQARFPAPNLFYKSIDHAYGEVAGARNLTSFRYLCQVGSGSCSAAKADFPLVLLARIKAWLRYWRSLVWWQIPSIRRDLTPLGRFSNLSSPGRTDRKFSIRRTDGSRKDVVESQRAERIGTTAPISRPRARCSSSPGGRNRYWQSISLCRSSARSGPTTGATIRVFHC